MFCDAYFKALVSFVLHAINKLRSLQARRVGIFSLYVHINIMKVPRRAEASQKLLKLTHVMLLFNCELMCAVGVHKF